MTGFLLPAALLLLVLLAGTMALSFVRRPAARRLLTPAALLLGGLCLAGALGVEPLLTNAIGEAGTIGLFAQEQATTLLLAKFSLFRSVSGLFVGLVLAMAAVLLGLSHYKRDPRLMRIIQALLPVFAAALLGLGGYYAGGSINQLFDLAPYLLAQAVCECGLLLLPMLWAALARQGMESKAR